MHHVCLCVTKRATKMTKRFTGEDLRDLFGAEGYRVSLTDCRYILKASSIIQFSNVVACNEPDEAVRTRAEERAEKAIATLNKKLAQIQADNPDQPVITVEVGGDPRGFPIRLFLPSGRYNSFGGREAGWGVSAWSIREGW